MYYITLIAVIAAFGFLVYSTIKIFLGANIIDPKKAVYGQRIAEKYGRLITIIGYIVTSFLCLVLIIGDWKTILDIPDAIKQNYSVKSGIVMEKVLYSGTGKSKEVKVKILDDKTNTIFEFKTGTNKVIEKGEHIKIYYYPKSRYGFYRNIE